MAEYLTEADREMLAEAALREHEPGFANAQGSRLRDALLSQFREVVAAQEPIIAAIIADRFDAAARAVEAIRPEGAEQWVEGGLAMRNTAAHVVRSSSFGSRPDEPISRTPAEETP